MKDHPLADAFRALREDDKTLDELALMYKEEGNEWMKKIKEKKSVTEAYNCYSHALNLVNEAFEQMQKSDAEGKSVDESSDSKNREEEEDEEEKKRKKTADLIKLKGQIFSNRALASLTLKNYGSCYRDAEMVQIYIFIYKL
jgi:hypothetical protein